MSSTVSQLRAQWSSPGDVLSLFLIIGGDIIQKALAQTSVRGVPAVCFSFGWVAYSFTTLVGVIGDGRLLPPPDYPVKVFNLKSGYVRENKNWVIGRILRDNEVYMNKKAPLDGAGIRISIYTALPRRKRRVVRDLFTLTGILWLIVTVAQLGVAVVPLVKDRERAVFLVTGSGVVATFLAGILPQWQVEKLPVRRNTTKLIALTSGNGSREIMIIYGAEQGLDLEDLAAGESPRSDRVWGSLKLFSKSKRGANNEKLNWPGGNEMRTPFMFYGLPIGLWFTRVACLLQLIFWVALLISVAGLHSHSWYLVLVGSLSMLQNVVVAAIARPPEFRGLPLRLNDIIKTNRTMDGLMDLECTIDGAGHVLRDEFFPGSLNTDEFAWWQARRRNSHDERHTKYDKERHKDRTRGPPRSWLDRKLQVMDIPEISSKDKVRFYGRMPIWEDDLEGVLTQVSSTTESPEEARNHSQSPRIRSPLRGDVTTDPSRSEAIYSLPTELYSTSPSIEKA